MRTSKDAKSESMRRAVKVRRMRPITRKYRRPQHRGRRPFVTSTKE